MVEQNRFFALLECLMLAMTEDTSKYIRESTLANSKGGTVELKENNFQDIHSTKAQDYLDIFN